MMKILKTNPILASLLMSMIALSNVALASQFEILMSFNFDFHDGTGQNYIFETKDINAPLEALPSQIYQWRLLAGRDISNLTFEAMPSPSRRKLKKERISIYMDFDRMTIQFDETNPILFQRSSPRENEDLLKRVNSSPIS